MAVVMLVKMRDDTGMTEPHSSLKAKCKFEKFGDLSLKVTRQNIVVTHLRT